MKSINKMVIGEGSRAWTNRPTTPTPPTTGSAFGEDDSEFNLFNTNRQLAALQTAVKMLGTLNEKKVLIYFASGLTPERRGQPGAVPGHHQRRHPRQRHVLHHRRARPGGAWRRWAMPPRDRPAAPAMYSGAGALAASDATFNRPRTPCMRWPPDTGGKALLDNNDLSVGIVERAESHLQLLHHRLLHHQHQPGRQVPAHQDRAQGNTSAKLDYRQGYFGGKEFNKFTPADKERQLEEALMLGDPITDLTIAMEVNYFQFNSRRVLRASGDEDSRQRAGAGPPRRRRAHGDRFHRRNQGRVQPPSATCATKWISS